MNRLIKTILIAFVSCGLIFTSLLAWADDYIYDISEKTGIKIEIISKTVDRFYEDKKNTQNKFSVASYSLEDAYLVTPFSIYKMINAHNSGLAIEDMAADYGRFMLPIVTNDGNEGIVTFECSGGHLKYLGMGVAEEGRNISALRIKSVLEACSRLKLEVTDVNIFINDLYHMSISAVDTETGRYYVPCSFGYYGQYGIEDYSIYGENEFWALLESVFDEENMDPDSDGGVPLRNEINESGKSSKKNAEKKSIDPIADMDAFDDNSLPLFAYILVAVGAACGIAICLRVLLKKKQNL